MLHKEQDSCLFLFEVTVTVVFIPKATLRSNAFIHFAVAEPNSS